MEGIIMKTRRLSILTLVLIGVLLASLPARADMSAAISYAETDLGDGTWQYDYVFQNTSSVDADHQYLQSVILYLDVDTTVTILSSLADWSSYTFTGSANVGDSVVTDYLEFYSDTLASDVAIGAILSGLSFTTTDKLGDIAFEAIFSDHAVMEDFASVSGTTSAVPIPATAWLLGLGLSGLAGLKRRLCK